MRFPHHGVVLANPELLEPERVGPDDVLQVPLVAILETALRRMTRHREYAELHAFPFTVQIAVAPRSGNDASRGERPTAFCTACVASVLPPALGGRGRIAAAPVRLLPCFSTAIYRKDWGVLQLCTFTTISAMLTLSLERASCVYLDAIIGGQEDTRARPEGGHSRGPAPERGRPPAIDGFSFDAATALDTVKARVDPRPTLLELLVRHVLLPREFLLQIEINSAVECDGIGRNVTHQSQKVCPIIRVVLPAPVPRPSGAASTSC